jgi:hypothetical protein
LSFSAGKVVNAGASLAIGVKDVPLHLSRDGSYINQVEDAYNNYVILYDADETRAWLMNGATALLHIVRASLRDMLTSKFRSHLVFEPHRLEEAPIQYTSDSAIHVLTCRSNMELKITRDKDEIWTETTEKEDGSQEKVVKKKAKYFRFQDLVDQKWHILEQILDRQSKLTASGFEIRMPGRRYLEGFDFVDVSTRIQNLKPKVTTLQARGKAWVDFTRSIGAVTLFGRGFGELMQPARNATDVCPNWNLLPKGYDYLAVSISDLEAISERRGDPNASPMKLVDDICWHKPDKLTEACSCKGQNLKRKYSGLTSSCDRVQVLMPTSSRKPRLISPGPLGSISQGAAIFGHSKTYPLRWSDFGKPEEGEVTSPPEEHGLSANPQDSGLGSSIHSQSSIVDDQSSTKRSKRNA